MRIKKSLGVVILVIPMLIFHGCGRMEETQETLGNDTVTPTEALTVAAESITSNPANSKEKQELTEEKIQIPENSIAFSRMKYFYSRDLDLELLSNKPGKIYYTTDGSEPDAESELYTQAIILKATDTVKATCFKAKAYFDDGTESDTIVHTYFIGTEIEDRFNTLVFSVVTDPYNLYDEDYGIFAEGKLRADFIAAHPGEKINPDAPANYNMRGKESEREVYLEVLEADGTKVAGQAAGIRTYGGWSRAREQKSIKLYARKEYDEENNKFRYEFFPQKTSADGNGNILDSFKQLVLRNCGNDNGFGFIRDELFQTLAGQAGYLDYEAVRPAALFVNGDYRGFFWLHEVYCDEYFADHYGEYEGSFELLEGGETYKNEDTDGENTEISKEYSSMYHKLTVLDLRDDANYQLVCDAIDVKNYLEYYAFNLYINNEDWPHNNYKTYRYYTSDKEDYREAPFDGKWRYLFHDTDYSFGIYGSPADTNNLSKYIGINNMVSQDAPLFSQLMKRQDCREIFVTKTLDLLNGALSPMILSRVLDEMDMERINELQHTYRKELLEDWVSPLDLSNRLREMKDYASKRAGFILNSYKDYFRMGEIYALGIRNTEGCKIGINSYQTDGDFEGSYYTNLDTVISFLPENGRELDYWIVNGERIEGKEITITSDMVQNNLVEVSFVLK